MVTKKIAVTLQYQTNELNSMKREDFIYVVLLFILAGLALFCAGYLLNDGLYLILGILIPFVTTLAGLALISEN